MDSKVKGKISNIFEINKFLEFAANEEMCLCPHENISLPKTEEDAFFELEMLDPVTPIFLEQRTNTPRSFLPLCGLRSASKQKDYMYCCGDPQYRAIAVRDRKYNEYDLRYLEIGKQLQPIDFLRILNSDDKNALDTVPVTSLRMPYDRDIRARLQLTVKLCVGNSKILENHEVRLGRLLKVRSVVIFNGYHTVRDLTNMFKCVFDDLAEDIYDGEGLVHSAPGKTRFPGSFIFIHDTFYIDKQEPNSEEMAQLVQEFVHKHNICGPTKIMHMDVTLTSLTCRLGYKYVYIHQGYCEHLIVFADICIREQPINNTNTPVVVWKKRNKVPMCAGCPKKAQRAIISEDTGREHYSKKGSEYWLEDTPAHLCNACFKKFCLSKNGTKLFDFKSYLLNSTMDDEQDFCSMDDSDNED